MATYNKPDVYVEETLTPTAQVATATANSVAAFVGNTDRGPTETVSGSVVGVPTLVNSWSEFVNKFGFGSTANAFSTVGTTNADMKYALKTFFDNGGSQAYVLRTPNTDATKAAVSFRDQNVSIPIAGTWTFTATTSSVTISSSVAGTFSGAYAGTTVFISGGGIPATYNTIANKYWVISASTSTSITIPATFVSAPATTTATANITITGALTSSTATLTVKAKDEGTWGNSVWVSTQPSSVSNYFDLYVYYASNASVAADISDSNRVEFFPQLSMTSTDARYAPAVVSSNWVTLTDANSGAVGAADLPAFTGAWAYTSGSANISSTDGSFVWNKNGFTAAPVKLGSSSGTAVAASPASVVGSAGSAAPAIDTVTLPRLDAVVGPLVLNLPNVTLAATVNAALNYAGTRGDIFVVVDTVAGASVTTALATVAGYTSLSKKYGAAYYPAITIADPASRTGGTIAIPTGGAVSAIYVATDTKRGAYKAPAGTAARIAGAVSVPGLSNSDFDTISAADTPVNVIRYIPGTGICIMGARTLSNTYADRYVPTRRTLIYLRRKLTTLTQFSVFEPNDSNTWSKITSTVENFLYQYWNQGGLYGTSPSAAYYVKCDADTNTQAARDAGELRIEIGVALQKPAEFVIIKIGQLDGGATVTTSI